MHVVDGIPPNIRYKQKCKWLIWVGGWEEPAEEMMSKRKKGRELMKGVGGYSAHENQEMGG
jgi:hypothetical protein